MTYVAELPERGVIEISGEDRVSFLQGLVSNDVAEAAPGRAVWAAFLTPQGKWLADFFIHADGERLLLDVERAQIGMLVPKLARYRLRAKVAVAPADTCAVYAAWAVDGAADVKIWGPCAAPDPRLSKAGWRIVSQTPIPADSTASDYDLHRLTLGLPDGSRDLEAEKTILLEAGFDELHGVSWSKGCYMGQELTARTKYRGLVKRRLVPVAIDGPPPAPGTPVMKDGMEVGTMRSSRDIHGLATIRMDVLSTPLTCGEARLIPRAPEWMTIA